MLRRHLELAIIVSLCVSGLCPGASAQKRLTLEQVSNPESIVPPGISRSRWRPEHSALTFLRTEQKDGTSEKLVESYDPETLKETTLLNPQTLSSDVDPESYEWSPKGDAILFSGGTNLYLYNVSAKRLRRLTNDSAAKEFPTFSPTGDRIAFVEANDLYDLDLATGKIEQLTTDGSEVVYNGKFDWVYEEELADRATAGAYEWAPDGKEIAYLRLDDSPVPVYPITTYLSMHVKLIRERFPQAGDPNPIATFHVVRVGKGTPKDWSFHFTPAMDMEYVGPEFSWTPDSQSVAFLTLNRPQTVETVHLWNPEGGTDQVLVQEKDPYWINSHTAPYLLSDGRRFLWLSERDGWMHLYLYGMDGKLLAKETEGDWMIDHPLFSDAPMFEVDEKRGWIYFASTRPDPRQRQLYRVRLGGNEMERLTHQSGTHALSLSPDGRYLADRYSNYQMPPETRLLESDGRLLATIDKPENHHAEYRTGTTKFIDVLAPDGATLYARLVLPPDFNPRKKYPVIVNVYNGPEVQLVQNRWRVTTFFDLYCAQEGYLVWTLDGRGSWGRGHAWESVIFKQMGKHELADQLTGVKYLESLPYVDSHRIGIWGWSYGGYMTLYALTHAPKVFKCGVAGGPVTAWKFYDSIYTERYMRTPLENPQGYKESSPLYAASQLRGKVLLIHGADDDNVHMQNTMNFVQALVEADHPFALYIQPGQKHGFSGKTIRHYLDERIFDFFKEHL
jgi:dipeptidyl-peptidase 4